MSKEPISEQIYEYLIESGEERACDAISEDSCKEAPGNFLLNGLNGFCTKLAEQIASPGLIIPYIFSLMGVPAFYSGLLVPIKNTGSLLPQLIVSAKIRAFKIRKYFWVASGFFQGIMLLLMAFVFFNYEKGMVGILVTFLLLLFSMASGVGSISFKDVMGKTIPKGKRGRLLSFRATGGGMLTILAGLFLHYIVGGDNFDSFIWLFVGAGILWIFSAILFAFIKEEPGATSGGRSPIDEVKNGWSLIKNDTNFRRFLITRALLLSIPLVQPFFVLYATENMDVELSGLGLFMIAAGISNAVSSPFWGKFADRSSRKVMIFSSGFAIMICLYVLLFDKLPSETQNIYFFGPVFFLIIMAYGGARMARKTYLVDYAPSDERPLYVSVANTFMGVMTLLSGILSVLAGLFGIKVMIASLMLLMILASIYGSKLKEV